jgi:glycosyltransferase involved in cell wall biosynthesis
MKFTIITRCTRPENLSLIKQSILDIKSIFDSIEWLIMFDIRAVGSLRRDTLNILTDDWIHVKHFLGKPKDFGYSHINEVIRTNFSSSTQWLYLLDDDTVLHNNFPRVINTALKATESTYFIIFDQEVSGRDWSGLHSRVACRENLKVSKVDVGQYVVRGDIASTIKYPEFEYCADGKYMEQVAAKYPDNIYFLNEECSHYNFIEKANNKGLPRVICVDEDISKIKYEPLAAYETSELEIVRLSEQELISNFQYWDPDAIVSTSGEWRDKQALCEASLNVRLRWLHAPSCGSTVYNCPNSYIMKGDDTLISIFTPVYKTGSKLLRAYQSLKWQTYNNWEWVLLRDAEDKETDDVISECAKDPRVKVFTTYPLSHGRIGESKYRAATLTNGKYLIELDHDDQLRRDALELIDKAFKAYPDAGFAYSGCAEIDTNYKSYTYPSGFALGYGSYRKETHFNVVMECSIAPNINPLTIRHIVGVPNHVRVWRRDTYFNLKGHNTRLTIADDYELLVRTFLHTKFVRIDHTLYYQYMHDSNTTDKRRKDIQRRVRSISMHYNSDIKKRFQELGVEDWGFTANSNCPWSAKARHGDQENYVNYIYR